MADIERWKEDEDVQKVLTVLDPDVFETSGWEDQCPACRAAAEGLINILKSRDEAQDELLQYQIATVKMAYALAGSWSGNGSGPKQPGFWLTQILGEGYDESIIELYKPPSPSIQVVAKCGRCQEQYTVGYSKPGHPVSAPKDPICPKCVGFGNSDT